jgi:hypothetical protein
MDRTPRHGSRKRLVAAMTLAGAIAATQVGFAGVATAADIGDGQSPCNKYELCYSKDNPKSQWQKDYFDSGDDGVGSQYFVDVNSGNAGPTKVLNNASSMNNRDSECDVKVVDYNSDGTVILASQDFSNHPDTNSWVGFTSRMNDHNDAHLRCGHY